MIVSEFMHNFRHLPSDKRLLCGTPVVWRLPGLCHRIAGIHVFRVTRMNKAFVREPDFDGRAYCPRCGSLGAPVHGGTLDHHVRPESRSQIADSAWFCEFAQCDVGYFDQFERCVEVQELRSAVYPKDSAAPICACFRFAADDIDADVREGTPTRIRQLLDKSRSDAANCQTLAADGRCCMREVQRLYMKGIAAAGE